MKNIGKTQTFYSGFGFKVKTYPGWPKPVFSVVRAWICGPRITGLIHGQRVHTSVTGFLVQVGVRVRATN